MHERQFLQITKERGTRAARRPPFCNINSKMAAGRRLAKVVGIGNYKRRGAARRVVGLKREDLWPADARNA